MHKVTILPSPAPEQVQSICCGWNWGCRGGRGELEGPLLSVLAQMSLGLQPSPVQRLGQLCS